MYKIYQKSVLGVSVFFFMSVFSQEKQDANNRLIEDQKNFQLQIINSLSLNHL